MISNPDGLASSALLEVPRASRSILRRQNITDYQEVAATKTKAKHPEFKTKMRFDRSELERIMGVPGVESKVGWLKSLKLERPDYFCVAEQLKNGEYEIISCGSVKYEAEQCTEMAYSPRLEHDVYVRPSSLASSPKIQSRARSPARAYAHA